MTEIAVLITAYHSHNLVLQKKTLEPWVEYGKFSVFLSYDDVNCPVPIPKDVKVLSASKQWGWQIGERRNILRGAMKIHEMGYRYVFKICGDVLVEYPIEVESLPDELGEVDMIGHEWGDNLRHIGPQILFAQTKSLLAICEHLKDDLSTEKHIERMYGDAALELGIKWENKPIRWWEDRVGYIHLHDWNNREEAKSTDDESIKRSSYLRWTKEKGFI